ncbi:hypothetical protein [Nocardia abscessus]|uniref:hypothetical protein n=1 Tax=Nocardia abscessus TaxID=120957 RepID=UPI002454B841|nr:hypothetical protein [Nocardia abscessus]
MGTLHGELLVLACLPVKSLEGHCNLLRLTPNRLRCMVFVWNSLSRRLVPDELCELGKPLLPKFTPRPQDGGVVVPVGHRVVFTAVVYALTSGCA